MYSINGKFLTRKMNGQIRVATEIIKELDKIIKPGFVEVVAPYSEYEISGLSNIVVKRVGGGNPHIWEQLTFPLYLIKNNNVGVNILNSHPIFKPDIAYIHDVLFKAYPDFYNNFYGLVQKHYVLLMALSAVKLGKEIITVSEFSKNEILKYYRVDSRKIKVIYNSWQHFNDIKLDESIFDNENIERNGYFLAASAQTPQKNFQWIIGNARCNKTSKYIIVGGKEGTTANTIDRMDNVMFIGRVSDGKLKALMRYANAFVHPAFYEGFGLTPMEAMASGCKNVIVANASCLPEIYGDSVFYIDPTNSNINIGDVISKKLDHDEVLAKYSWEKSAMKLRDVLTEHC